MLSTLTCWVIALGIIFSKSASREDLYIKMLLAMGFIFLATINKAVEYYFSVNGKEDKDNGKDGSDVT